MDSSKYQDTFASSADLEVLRDILDFAGVGRTPFDPDPHKNAFLCGRHSVGVYIANKLKEANNGRTSTGSDHRPRSGSNDSASGDDGTRTDPVDPDKFKHPTNGRFIP